ncbi:FecR family protein [Pseudomonas sp. GD03842]|uniref:FecR family protein n=1 Tax=Pseudomonas sp. GD03842 TaxID=2975385 RepID=UPI002446EAA6|nr:FecR family protein [Pseudomonas sp. GD03842]MDH0747376.1 FecR family protein [Pseudomonas sp. GD03842]
MSISTRPVSSKVLDAAIAWQLCLDGGQASEADREEFAKWYAASDEHARAWRQLGMLDQRFASTTGPARSALIRSREGVSRQMRKLGRGVAGIAIALGLTLVLGERFVPIDYWLADQRTATGEQRTIRLSDHTLIRLNTHSALDVKFDAKQRRIILQAGEIFVETGSHNDPRPFIVETDEGQMRALGTKFLVKRRDDGTLLSVLQSAVAAHPRATGNEMILHEGQQMLIQRHSLGPMVALEPGADAWLRGMLVVDNAPLKDVIAELSRYRPGYLSVAPSVADLRITGSFPLNDTDLALKALTPTLPVAIEARTHWWVTVIPSDTRETRKL